MPSSNPKTRAAAGISHALLHTSALPREFAAARGVEALGADAGARDDAGAEGAITAGETAATDAAGTLEADVGTDVETEAEEAATAGVDAGASAGATAGDFGAGCGGGGGDAASRIAFAVVGIVSVLPASSRPLSPALKARGLPWYRASTICCKVTPSGFSLLAIANSVSPSSVRIVRCEGRLPSEAAAARGDAGAVAAGLLAGAVGDAAEAVDAVWGDVPLSKTVYSRLMRPSEERASTIRSTKVDDTG